MSLQLPRTIFSVQDELPTWPSDDDNMGLESISEPDDMDLDDEADTDDDDAGVGVLDDSEAEEEQQQEGGFVDLDAEGAAAPEEEADSDKFFDACSGSTSTPCTGAGSNRYRHGRPKSDDVCRSFSSDRT